MIVLVNHLAKKSLLIFLGLLTDPELLKEAQAFFEEAMEGKPYKSPLPADQAPPLPGGDRD